MTRAISEPTDRGDAEGGLGKVDLDRGVGDIWLMTILPEVFGGLTIVSQHGNSLTYRDLLLRVLSLD